MCVCVRAPMYKHCIHGYVYTYEYVHIYKKVRAYFAYCGKYPSSGEPIGGTSYFGGFR